MQYSHANAASRWISVEEFLPRNEEIIAFWVNEPKSILLFGSYFGDDKDGFFVSYVDSKRCSTPERFTASSGNVLCWCRFSFPQEQREMTSTKLKETTGNEKVKGSGVYG